MGRVGAERRRSGIQCGDNRLIVILVYFLMTNPETCQIARETGAADGDVSLKVENRLDRAESSEPRGVLGISSKSLVSL